PAPYPSCSYPPCPFRVLVFDARMPTTRPRVTPCGAALPGPVSNEAPPHWIPLRAVRPVQPPDHHLRPLARDRVEAKFLGFAATQNTRCCDHERGSTVRRPAGAVKGSAQKISRDRAERAPRCVNAMATQPV